MERLSASGKDAELIRDEIDTLWKVLEACLAVTDELQKVYMHLGDNDSKKSDAEEAEGLDYCRRERDLLKLKVRQLQKRLSKTRKQREELKRKIKEFKRVTNKVNNVVCYCCNYFLFW